MPKEAYVHTAGNWHKVKEVHNYTNGSWRKDSEGYVYTGGQHKKWWPSITYAEVDIGSGWELLPGYPGDAIGSLACQWDATATALKDRVYVLNNGYTSNSPFKIKLYSWQNGTWQTCSVPPYTAPQDTSPFYVPNKRGNGAFSAGISSDFSGPAIVFNAYNNIPGGVAGVISTTPTSPLVFTRNSVRDPIATKYQPSNIFGASCNVFGSGSNNFLWADNGQLFEGGLTPTPPDVNGEVFGVAVGNANRDIAFAGYGLNVKMYRNNKKSSTGVTGTNPPASLIPYLSGIDTEGIFSKKSDYGATLLVDIRYSGHYVIYTNFEGSSATVAGGYRGISWNPTPFVGPIFSFGFTSTSAPDTPTTGYLSQDCRYYCGILPEPKGPNGEDLNILPRNTSPGTDTKWYRTNIPEDSPVKVICRGGEYLYGVYANNLYRIKPTITMLSPNSPVVVPNNPNAIFVSAPQVTAAKSEIAPEEELTINISGSVTSTGVAPIYNIVERTGIEYGS